MPLTVSGTIRFTSLLAVSIFLFCSAIVKGNDPLSPNTGLIDLSGGHDHPSPLIDFAALDSPHHGHDEPVANSDGGLPLTDTTAPAAGEATSSYGGIARPSESPPSPNYPDLEQLHTIVPTFGETAIPYKERWHLERMLKFRLSQAHIDFRTLRLVDPLEDTRHLHLRILQSQLQLQVNSKQAVFLGPTEDHQARIYAVPIHRDTVKEALIEKEKTGRVGWAFIAVRPGLRPEMTWLSYALLDVQSRRTFVENLMTSKNVKALKDILKLTG